MCKNKWIISFSRICFAELYAISYTHSFIFHEILLCNYIKLWTSPHYAIHPCIPWSMILISSGKSEPYLLVSLSSNLSFVFLGSYWLKVGKKQKIKLVLLNSPWPLWRIFWVVLNDIHSNLLIISPLNPDLKYTSKIFITQLPLQLLF